MSPEAMAKWTARQNARRTMEFGVEAPITWGPKAERAGQSNRRHYALNNVSKARSMAQENLDVLKLMKSPRLP